MDFYNRDIGMRNFGEDMLQFKTNAHILLRV